jgi:hypothetical protein
MNSQDPKKPLRNNLTATKKDGDYTHTQNDSVRTCPDRGPTLRGRNHKEKPFKNVEKYYSWRRDFFLKIHLKRENLDGVLESVLEQW